MKKTLSIFLFLIAPGFLCAQNSGADILDKIIIEPQVFLARDYYRVGKSSEVNMSQLPDSVCTIFIYDSQSELVRALVKEQGRTSITWDLFDKDKKPLKAGLYVIYIMAQGIGEKTFRLNVSGFQGDSF